MGRPRPTGLKYTGGATMSASRPELDATAVAALAARIDGLIIGPGDRSQVRADERA